MRYFFVTVAIVLMDQVTKHEVRENLSVGKSIDIIEDVFEVTGW